MKMLYILNVAKRVNNFSYTSMLAAKECGFEFHIAGNWLYETNEELIEDEKKYGIHIHQIDFERAPYSFKNKKAYKQLLSLCLKEQFDIIHCNTPVGGLYGRIVGIKCNVKTIIYQAHGFHFYKGAPLINWLIYYPIEKWLARKTDILITINSEDYEIAKKRMKLRKGGHIEYVPGVGIDVESFKNEQINRIKKRKELSLKENDIAVISVGDLIKRKNYQVSIEALSKTKNKNIKLFICGVGPEQKKLEKLIQKLKLKDRVFLLGFRNDVKELLGAMDIFLITSKQEGIPRSTMEAMASSLPCVASNIRGNKDLLIGFEELLFKYNDFYDLSCRLDFFSSNCNLRNIIGSKLFNKIQSFDNSKITKAYKTIYLALK